MYGQSRSAAVVISYLMYSGMAIGDAIAKLKRLRPVICINPGFLAQLFLISCCGFDSAVPQLLIQDVLKHASAKTGYSKVDTNAEKEMHRKDYVDSYKSISSTGKVLTHDHVSDGIRYSNESINNIDVSREGGSCEGRLDHDSSSGHHDSSCDATKPENDTVLCKECRSVLAHEKDIVHPVDYSEFLSLSTDPYWSGYRAIHPHDASVVTVDTKKGRNPNFKRAKREINHKNLLRHKNAALESISMNEKITAVGPIYWIRDQLEKSHSASRNVGSAVSDCDIKRTDGIQRTSQQDDRYFTDLKCPNCSVVCGYSRRYGLEICHSFLRCDLFALRASETIMCNSTHLT